MPNTLTNLIPDAYAALDVVSRELTGFIPSVARDSSADRAAVGQNIRIPVVPASTAADITPAMTLPSAAYQTVTNKAFTITKSRGVSFSWQGEEVMAMDKGPGFLSLRADQIAQALRTLCNEIESDLSVAAYQGASRAYGTAGTTPFASTLGDPAQVRKVLDDNGAPITDRHLIIDTASGAALRTLAQLTKVNEAGDSSMLRQGEILNIHGFAIRESAQVKTATIGTGTGYLINNGAGYVVGDTALTVDTGSGTVLAGDYITIAGDTNKYVVATALAANVITIAAPGLRKAAADNAAVSVGALHASNVAFSRNALLLGTRLPALPKEGDLAIDRATISDPRSGLSFELAAYGAFRMVTYMVMASWGTLAVKSEHSAILVG